MATARSVAVVPEAVVAVAEHPALRTRPAADWHSPWHWFDGTERSATAILALDAVNFCFWGDRDGDPRWQVTMNGECLNGYWACAACMKRAIDSGRALYDAHYLARLTHVDVAEIFAGDAGQPPIPLLEERLLCLREVGDVLLHTYQGRISNLLAIASEDAVQLTLLLADDFSSFRDVACYNGIDVRLCKRAQITVADLHGAFTGEGFGRFRNMESLTAFADYKVPQVLRRYGVLVYEDALAATIDRSQHIPAGVPWEVEIRAATVCAVDDIRTAMARRGVRRTAPEIDWHLWLLGQERDPLDRPYHRTRTIFY